MNILQEHTLVSLMADSFHLVIGLILLFVQFVVLLAIVIAALFAMPFLLLAPVVIIGAIINVSGIALHGLGLI